MALAVPRHANLERYAQRLKVRLGRKGDYAVRAMLDLAKHEQSGRRKTREIAEAMAIPMTYVHTSSPSSSPPGSCRRWPGRAAGTECAVHRLWASAQEAFRERLRAVSRSPTSPLSTQSCQERRPEQRA